MHILDCKEDNKMDKKIVIGSILIVVILGLVSLTSVIGIQSLESSTRNSDSPLFNLRLKKAINADTPTLKSNYIKKDENTLHLLSILASIGDIPGKQYFSINDGCNASTSACPSYNKPCTYWPWCGPTDNGPFCDDDHVFDDAPLDW